MNPPLPSEDQQADAFLRTHLAMPPLPDDGFSQRVALVLPPRQPAFGHRRVALISAGTLLGGTIAAIKLFDSDAAGYGVPAPLADVGLFATFIAIALSLVLAFRPVARWLGD